MPAVDSRPLPVADADTPAAVLAAARKTLSDPARWSRDACACDAQGREVGALSAEATSWCGYGALRRHGAHEDGPAGDLLRAAAHELFGMMPVRVNVGIGYPAILQIYDRAIALASSGLSGRPLRPGVR